jgi:hypothetical protein
MFSSFVVADSDSIINVREKYLAIADLPGAPSGQSFGLLSLPARPAIQAPALS